MSNCKLRKISKQPKRVKKNHAFWHRLNLATNPTATVRDLSILDGVWC
jgi:hypothetical protein